MALDYGANIRMSLGAIPATASGQPVRKFLSFAPFRNVVQLNVYGAADLHYQILASSNLPDWLEISTVLATNNWFQFTDSNPPAWGCGFYRALTEP